ncbi:MAG: hypothetical protein E5X15_20835 [Mesorhizobium sp.]|uniref:hypothetical protein n=1 Tax=Mesorhizobium sp. TaxID=1871066 RepID=UPI000FE933F8|nr:hypothetical protein [Mesorhizobium sp.]RWL81992.1 MAG: hypothetical protein EOR67_28280 [Mesorhizobium sp.]TIO79418.1 MAG: hypothetical protein E5X75_02355 [Mesorhizobium sp.]TIR74892.1 MAG: hypothetical protein E5X15_20835 [Mesorhizobium sp.]
MKDHRLANLKNVHLPALKSALEAKWTDEVERHLRKFETRLREIAPEEIREFYDQASRWLTEAKAYENLHGHEALLDRTHRYCRISDAARNGKLSQLQLETGSFI